MRWIQEKDEGYRTKVQIMNKISKALYKAKHESIQQQGKSETHVLEIGSPIKIKQADYRTTVQHPRPKQLERSRILSQIKDQHVQDAYNLLRTQILQKTANKSLNTIMITSPKPGEGKTTTAINLGLSISRNQQFTALVVDTHLRSPKVHHYLDLDCPHGLSDFLLDGVSIPELLVTPDENDFAVLPSGRSLQSSTDILSSQAMKELVMELKHRYADRYILFDCPHLLSMPDSLVFARYVDAILLVVEANKTKQEEIQESIDILKEQNILGLVLNKTQ